MNYFHLLSNDVLGYLLEYLNVESLYQFSQTCKRHYKMFDVILKRKADGIEEIDEGNDFEKERYFWKIRKNGTIFCILFSEYGVSTSDFDVDLYDWEIRIDQLLLYMNYGEINSIKLGW